MCGTAHLPATHERWAIENSDDISIYNIYLHPQSYRLHLNITLYYFTSSFLHAKYK